MSIKDDLLQAFDRAPPANPTEWHEWSVFLPVRDPEGHLVLGRCWRRRTLNGKWQYKDRPETPEDFIDRAI